MTGLRPETAAAETTHEQRDLCTSGYRLGRVLDFIFAVLDCAKMAATMSPDDLLETFSNLAAKNLT